MVGINKMNNEYSMASIEKLRIHELRDFAKSVGISSPTTMRKNELIAKISSIVGSSDASADNKHIVTQDSIDFFTLLTTDNNNLINSLLKSTEKDAPKKIETKAANTVIMRTKDTPYSELGYSGNSYVGFSFKLNQNEAPYYVNSPDVVEGYLDIHPTGYGIVRYNNFVPDEKDVYITSNMVKQNKLFKGYKVRGKVREILAGKPKIMYEIQNIDIQQERSKMTTFEEYPYSPFGKEFYLNDFKYSIKSGERVYIDKLSYVDTVKLAKELQLENALNVKVINIKAKPEDYIQGTEKVNLINCLFSKSETEVVNAVELVVERVKREFEMNHNSLIIIYNFSELIRIFNAAIEGFYEFGRYSAQAITRIKNILNVAKYVGKYMSSTIICVDRNGVPRDLQDIFEVEFMPIFSNIIKNN